MATQQETQNANIRETFTPHAASAPPEIKIISHSNNFYWWPAWVAAFAVALISYTQGRDVAIVPKIIDRVHPSNNPGIFFIAVLVSLIVFTTTKLRGIYSVVTVVTVAFFIVLFAWFGWWDNILRLSPASRRARTWAFTSCSRPRCLPSGCLRSSCSIG